MAEKRKNDTGLKSVMEENWKNNTGLKLVMDEIGVNYDLLQYLGGGGLAKIYKLRHKIFNKFMALKIMDYNYIYQNLEKSNVEDIEGEFEKIKQRFEVEARIYKKFSHPGIVKIHQVGVVRYETRKIEIPYLIMEYIQGATLKEILKKQSPLDMGTIFRISECVLAALGMIHQAGIIHRDIKPSNIMIREENQEVVLIDFGLAKNIENGSDSSGITVTSTAMGTAKYNSPEMFRSSKNISIETDIYSFGVILYEMVTGEIPFKGSIVAIIYGHLNINKSIPEELFPQNLKFARELDRIIKKAMAKEVKDRYRSAGDFLKDLKKLEENENLEKIEIQPRTIKKKFKSKRILFKYVLPFFFIIIATTAALIVFNPFAPSNKIEAMVADFKELKTFLRDEATKYEKLEECREFLEKYKNIPGNNNTKAMESETKDFIAQLEAGITADTEYQKHIEAAKVYLERRDYAKAESELKKAIAIKNTNEVKQLSETIAKALEVEKTMYNGIKDQLNLTKYLDFRKKYPKSKYLTDLQNRLRRIDNVLPPENYWDSIQKNEKGYYESTFIIGKEKNNHRMIYIPGKGFWIDKYEVSWQQFRKFLQAEKMRLPPRKNKQYIKEEDEYPAVVTYENAERYCAKYGLRLPTADGWEYAAGKEEFTYPWGNESPDQGGIYRANFDSFEDGFEGTAPVYSFGKFSSPFGVVNMAGNAWEWVQGKNLEGGGFFSDKGDLAIGRRKPGKSGIEEGFRCIKKEK